MNSPRIGFVGGGNMARALIGGLIGRGTAASQLSVGEPAPAARESLAREFKVQVSADNRAAIDGCDLDRKSTRLNSSHSDLSRMPSSA